ncbi:MAG: biotin-dependent carboxyltransferase family protein [Thiolinea sp.]
MLEAQQDTVIAVTGADMPLSIGKQPRARWQTQPVKAGERIELGYAQQGCRSTYLAVAGGFQVEPMFGSTATVVREKLGGLHGKALANGDVLPCPATAAGSILLQQLATEHRPQYASSVTLRVIPGYQQAHFSAAQQALFFSSTYTVSEQCDRMGYRLEGQPVQADITSMLSEGICYGAIQIPANGQPIVLLNDRQTIGGYPKIGAVLSLDIARLTQLLPGGKVHFTPISQAEAHNALQLAAYRFAHTRLQPVENT